MKENKGFTLVELIVVLACLGGIIIFFWNILDSSSKDAYTINDKIEVQTSVTSLMNIIEQDVKEAKIVTVDGKKCIYCESDGYILSPEYDDDGKIQNGIRYKLNNKVVSREVIVNGIVENSSEYNFIVEFSMNKNANSAYGIDVSITGGKKDIGEFDKSRYELNTTYYTRNTI